MVYPGWCIQDERLSISVTSSLWNWILKLRAHSYSCSDSRSAQRKHHSGAFEPTKPCTLCLDVELSARMWMWIHTAWQQQWPLHIPFFCLFFSFFVWNFRRWGLHERCPLRFRVTNSIMYILVRVAVVAVVVIIFIDAFVLRPTQAEKLRTYDTDLGDTFFEPLPPLNMWYINTYGRTVNFSYLSQQTCYTIWELSAATATALAGCLQASMSKNLTGFYSTKLSHNNNNNNNKYLNFLWIQKEAVIVHNLFLLQLFYSKRLAKSIYSLCVYSCILCSSSFI